MIDKDDEINKNERSKFYEQNDIENMIVRNQIHSYQHPPEDESKEESNEVVNYGEDNYKSQNNFLLRKMQDQNNEKIIRPESTKERKNRKFKK